ncbi:MAG: helix-turn-helix domain-containing protein [Rhodospirillum sp.]|nr:helix-turn-helix domain-containing protein [Rhodospirillum sp.]MCF8488862.1 helix-turn-helix domain-containing protein [Rhodospirillum sp.]MCF8502927.1 helix-turn-helix domain-containing protein [Rhodospirillum sp.]
MGDAGKQRLLPTLTARIHRLEDVSQQVATQPWARLDCQQLLPGKFEGGIGVVELGGIRVVREFQNATVYKVGSMPDNLCTLSIVEDIDPAMRFSQFGHEAGRHVFFLPTGTECDIMIPGGTATLYLALDQDRLFTEARHLNPGRWDQIPTSALVIDTDRRANFVETMSSLFDLVSVQLGRGVLPDLARLERMVVSTAAQTLDVQGWEGDPGRPSGSRIVATMRAVRRYIRVSLARDELPTLSDMCAHVGVSERTLQYSFQDQVGMTPVAYLRVTRLNQARLDLTFPSSADITVTDVAMRWGFLHLGYFAKAYRDLFGETPSETLNRMPHRAAGWGLEGNRCR